MTEKSEALRLAAELAAELGYFRLCGKAAAELRRLHAENERLHQINQSHEMKLSVRGYEIQIEDLRLAHAELRERNAELLEALRWIERRCPAQLLLKDRHRIHIEAAHDAGACARAAIAKAEGEQT
jgi:hypothetical protein